MDDAEIRALVIRLARPHASGGDVIERAAILAEGADFAAVSGWIERHDGKPEAAVAAPVVKGLHGLRSGDLRAADQQVARRFVLPPGALS